MKTVSLVISLTWLSFIAQGQNHPQQVKKEHIMVQPQDVKWTDAPSTLPPGAKVAVLYGNPKDSGQFVMRLKVPANYKIAPHYHPADEHLTILKGSFNMGLGDKMNEASAMKITEGGIAVMPAGERHFAFTREETILQLHGIGPWGIIYVNPADDPSKKGEARTE